MWLRAIRKHDRGRLCDCWLVAAVFGLYLCCSAALAQQAGADTTKADETEEANPGIPSPSIATSFPEPYRDPGDIRRRLAERGITYKLNYTGEVISNVSGGLQRGTTYEGLGEFVLDVDFEKRIGWKGLSFHTNVFQIHNGVEPTPTFLGSLDRVSSIEARSTTRLFEAWFEQKLFDDRLSIRLGQLAADSEFIISRSAENFLNSTFGFPTIAAVDLPSGGPVYPLATPAVRVQIDPIPEISLLAAVFNGDPAGPGPASQNPENRNRYGLNFRIKDPPFIIGEAQFRRTPEKSSNDPSGRLKVGGWYHAETFDNVRFGTDGLSLAFGNGIPERMHGNWGIYGVLDQQIWRLPGGDEHKGVSVFARVAASPPDRNQISFYFDGGVVFDGVIPGRADDILAVGYSYSDISPSLSALDRDMLLAGTYTLIQDYESLFEVSYTAQIVPGWTIQPDFQYMWHPGGNVPINSAPGAPAIPNATVVGVRTTINY